MQIGKVSFEAHVLWLILRLISSSTRFSNDEEMNIVLLRLIEYLGHPNPFTSGVAYTEVC